MEETASKEFTTYAFIWLEGNNFLGLLLNLLKRKKKALMPKSSVNRLLNLPIPKNSY